MAQSQSTTNPSSSTPASGASAKLQEATEKFRDNATPRAREMIDNVSELTQDLYQRASGFFEGDKAKTAGLIAGIIGGVGAIGLIGFFLGRSSVSDTPKETY